MKARPFVAIEAVTGRIDAELEVATEPVDRRRGGPRIAQAREPVADRADVMVDTENLLPDDDPAPRLAVGIGAVGAEAMRVGRGERERFTHEDLQASEKRGVG